MGSGKDGVQPLKKSIPKIYKRHWLEGVLFGWVRAQTTLVESITLEQSILSFYKGLGITEDEFPMTDCITTYMRMNKELYNSEKTVKD